MEGQQYKTPCYQLIRQILMFLLTTVIAILTSVVSIITARINEHIDNVQYEIQNRTMFFKAIN